MGGYEEDFEGEALEELPLYRPPDPVVQTAIPAIEEYVEQHKDRVFYLRQLQVKFESQFFHWVTGKAVRELIGAGRLTLDVQPLHPGASGAEGVGQVNFVFHPSLRYRQREITRKLALIRRFSEDHVGHACGRQAEVLFSRALMAKGFELIAENTREYGILQWTKTGHDLDFIVAREGRVYGCEVKNRFEYIDRDELYTKIDICKYLGIHTAVHLAACG